MEGTSLKSLIIPLLDVKLDRFLQIGSPHPFASQYISADRSEIWVNVGYRLSVFGFLASDRPKLNGNYGFKDQWVALEWIKGNIEAFGGWWYISTLLLPSF